eukprot:3925016-Amphidinium_carterae.1
MPCSRRCREFPLRPYRLCQSLFRAVAMSRPRGLDKDSQSCPADLAPLLDGKFPAGEALQRVSRHHSGMCPPSCSTPK